ncbi:MAG: TolC family protein [bacterium]
MMRVHLAVFLCAISLLGSGVGPAFAQAPQAVSLEEAVATALLRHPTLAASAKSLEAAQARLVQARAGNALQVGLNGTTAIGTLSATGTPTSGGASVTHNVSVGASLPLFDGGERAAQITQAEAGVVAAQAALEATRQDIALAAAEAYFAVLRAMRVVEVREGALQSARRQVEQAEALVRAGTAARADVIRAQSVAASAEADLITARGAVELSLASLRNAIGIPITQLIAVREPPEIPVAEVPPAEAAAEAVRARPEIRRVQSEVVSSQAALRIAEIRSGLNVSAAANSSVQVSPNPGQIGWSISTSVSLPIADGGRARAAVEEARANLDAARARAEATAQQIQLEGFQSALTIQQTRARLEAVRVAAAAAEESLRVADGRYRAGVTILLEVLDAQVAATQARVNLVQTESDLRLAAFTLRHALGRPVLPSAQSAQSTQSTRP